MALGTIRAGGLSSGLDTQAIIDQLVALQKKPIEKIDQQVRAVGVKISTFGTISSRLRDITSAFADLSDEGVRALAVTTKNTSFSATTTSGGVPGSFNVEVQSVARSAKARSGALDSETAAVAGTELGFIIDGASYNVSIADGSSLRDVAKAINDADVPVTAAVLFDGTHAYLSITRNTTGHVVGELASSALSITETVTGSGGTTLNLAITQEAQNTVALVDGLRIERRTDSISGAIPGVTIKAIAAGPPETLNVTDDSAKTAERVKKFVDAYNKVMEVLQGELDLKAETDRGKTLGGDSSVRTLKDRLQTTLQTTVGTGVVRALADIGVKSERDGKLTIDTLQLDAAVARDGDAVDRLFKKDGALGAAFDAVVEAFADPNGIIDTRTKSLEGERRRLEESKAAQERRVEMMQELLVRQFTAMESIVANLKSQGTFLEQQFSSGSNKK